jgi:hypothetical protein
MLQAGKLIGIGVAIPFERAKIAMKETVAARESHATLHVTARVAARIIKTRRFQL